MNTGFAGAKHSLVLSFSLFTRSLFSFQSFNPPIIPPPSAHPPTHPLYPSPHHRITLMLCVAPPLPCPSIQHPHPDALRRTWSMPDTSVVGDSLIYRKHQASAHGNFAGNTEEIETEGERGEGGRGVEGVDGVTWRSSISSPNYVAGSPIGVPDADLTDAEYVEVVRAREAKREWGEAWWETTIFQSFTPAGLAAVEESVRAMRAMKAVEATRARGGADTDAVGSGTVSVDMADATTQAGATHNALSKRSTTTTTTTNSVVVPLGSFAGQVKRNPHGVDTGFVLLRLCASYLRALDYLHSAGENHCLNEGTMGVIRSTLLVY